MSVWLKITMKALVRTAGIALFISVLAILTLPPLYAQDETPDLPRFEDIFATDHVTLIDLPAPAEPAPYIPLPPDVEACPPGNRSERVESTSPDGRYLVYSDCDPITIMRNIGIYLYDSETGTTESLGMTPQYEVIWPLDWLDEAHLVLRGQSGGGDNAYRGAMVVDIAEKAVYDAGSSPIAGPDHIPGTPFFENLTMSYSEAPLRAFVAYNAFTNERETLFAVPLELLNRVTELEEMYVASNRSAANLEPDYLSVAYRYFPGADDMYVEIYDLETGALLHTQPTNNGFVGMNWVDETHLLLLNTDRETARDAAILVDVTDPIQTTAISGVYLDVSGYPYDSRSPSRRYLLMRPDEARVEVIDLLTMTRIPLVGSHPQDYALTLRWLTDHTLSATLSDQGETLIEWHLRLKVE